MAVRRTGRRAVRGWRPATFWDGFILTTPTAIPANNKVLVASFTNGFDQDLTLRRIRGLLSVHSDQQAATENQIGALGVAVFTNAAIAAGVALLPDPVSDINDDIWQTFTHIGQRFNFGTSVGFQGNVAVQYEIDSKAMRKLSEGRALGIVVANANATAAFNITLGMRFLLSITGC